MKLYKPVKVNKLRMSIKEFLDNFEKLQEADKAFQANIYTRWTEKQAGDFANSCILGQAPSKFIFADVQKCYDNAIKPSDKAYFKLWLDAGVRYLNLDSNNRCINILAFRNGEVPLIEGNYMIDDDMYPVETGKNDRYETLPQAVREQWDNSELDFEVYIDVTREQLSDIFLKINDGKPLNNPEKRNAMTSLVATVIRDLAMDYKDRFINDNVKWFTDTEENRRGLDDFIGSMCYHFIYNIDSNASPTSLQDMYEVNRLKDEEVMIFKKRFESFVKEVMIPEVNAITHKNMLFDLWVVYFKKLKKKQVVKPGEMQEFIKHYIKVVASLLDDIDTLYRHNQWKSPKTFDTLIGGRQPANNRTRYTAIKDKLDDKFFINKGQRNVSDTKKLQAAARDDFKTPEGKDIDLSKLNDGKTYHKGHIEPYADTLKSNLKNTVIQESGDNLKLGKRKVNM